MSTAIKAFVAALSACAFLAAAPANAAFSVAHRGASAYRPEHTLESYRLAIAQGADYVEQDLGITKDGVLVCSHDPSLERTTNVEEVFPDRFTADTVNGRTVKHWYIEDFTLAEIKRLDAGAWFDPQYAGMRVPTFQEAIDAVKGKAGFFPELKTPGRVRAKGFDMEQAVVDILKKNGLVGATFKGLPAVHLQVFEEDSLRRLARLLPDVPRSFLVGTAEALARWTAPAGIADLKTFATGIAPSLNITTAEVVARAHDAGLTVVPYTFLLRPTKVQYPDAPPELRKMIDDAYRNLPSDPKDLAARMRAFVEVYKVDGLFTDNPDLFPR